MSSEIIIIGLAVISCALCLVLLRFIRKNRTGIVGDLIITEDPVDGKQMFLMLYEDNLDHIVKRDVIKIKVKYKKP